MCRRQHRAAVGGPFTVGVGGAVPVCPSAKACLPAVSVRHVIVTTPVAGLRLRPVIITSRLSKPDLVLRDGDAVAGPIAHPAQLQRQRDRP
jgi:hypothetical protein